MYPFYEGVLAFNQTFNEDPGPLTFKLTCDPGTYETHLYWVNPDGEDVEVLPPHGVILQSMEEVMTFVQNTGTSLGGSIKIAKLPEGYFGTSGAMTSNLIAGTTYTNLKAVVFPKGFKTCATGSVHNNATNYIEYIYLPDTVTSLHSDFLKNIGADAVIDCGFAQNAVSGAPWGANANATINYGIGSERSSQYVS